MKLSELVNYKSSLDQYDFIRSSRGLIKKINESQTDIHNSGSIDEQILFSQGTYEQQLTEDLAELEDKINELQENYSYYKSQINELILDQEQEYLAQSEKRAVRVIGDAIDDIKNRQLRLSTKQKQEFISRINLYADWKYPGLIIRPEDQDIVEAMCAFDPFYISDFDQKLIDPYIKKFNPIYQNRVRGYAINKLLYRRKSLNDLPTEQFGFVVVYNFFDHYPLTLIKQMLAEIHTILKPGGTVLFTFNNCDLARNIRTFEQGLRSYVPYRLLEDVLKDLGFKITHAHNDEHSWVEVKKLGTLKSIRGGQAVAKVFNDIQENLDKEYYTADEKEKIRQEAIELGIDKEDVIRKGAISIGKLHLLVKRKKEQLRIEELSKTLEERIPWSASNQGYLKGQHVKHGGINYVARKDIQPKQKFDKTEWDLVE